MCHALRSFSIDAHSWPMAENRRKFMGVAAASLALGSASGQEVSNSTPASKPTLDSEKFRAAAVAGDLETTTKLLQADPGLIYARDANGNSVYTLACLA